MKTAGDIVATLNRPPDATSPQSDWNWAEQAVADWLDAARAAGLDPTVVSVEVADGDHDAAIVEVDGHAYTITVKDDDISAVPDPVVDADTVVKLYEDNADSLYLQADDGPVWNVGTEPVERDGRFCDDAATWIAGDWKPNERDGQTRTGEAGLRLLVTWTTTGGLQHIVRPDASMGATAAAYIAGGRGECTVRPA